MNEGTVVRFDATQGYGFITPDNGGEDVFLHASLLDDEAKDKLHVGTRVEFQAVHGERGLKAYTAKVLAKGPRSPSAIDATGGPSAPVAVAAPDSPPTREDEQLVDVVPAADFARRITEVLIEFAPDVTGAQIRKVREHLVEFARRHGWLDD